MSRQSTPCIALLAVALSAACDKPTSDARGEASDASAIQSDFAKARDDYRNQKQRDLDLLDRSLADLDAKEKVAAAKARVDLDGLLTTVKAQRSAFSGDLRGLDAATAADWDSTRAHLDKEWADLKATTDKATSVAVAAVGSVFKPSEMSCQDFVALADIEKPKIIYWAEGFNKNGKPGDSSVDVAETDRLVPVIVTECTKNPKQPLSTAIQAHPPKSPPAASAHKPTTMTCQEFVTLESATQPRLVYWAEGFDRDGGVDDSVVDIDETDRLVPVLVKECTETPKLTFWQKLKKYF
jgi:hypothetical protein